jgi:predicted transcriptional regulator
MPATLKLSDELKRRVGKAARIADKSPHAFMIEAIEETTRLAEQRQAFVAEARAAEARFADTGIAYEAKDVHRYFKDKIAGKKPKRPRPKVWR